MADQYDLSDLGGSVASDAQDLSAMGGEQITTPLDRASGIWEHIKSIIGGAKAPLGSAGRYGAGLLSGSAESVNKALMDIPGAKSVIPQSVQQKAFGEPFQQLEPSRAFQAGRAGGEPLGNVINLAGLDVLTGGAAPALEAAGGAIPGAAKAFEMMKNPMVKPWFRSFRGPAAMAGYGAATTPYDRLKGGEAGLMYGMGAETLPGIPGAIKGGLDRISPLLGPKAHAEKLLNELGGGKSVNQATQSLAKDINDMQTNIKSTSREKYAPIFKKYGDKNIYKEDMPEDGYFGLNTEVTANLPKPIKNEEEKFLRKPTFENAHKYQSELASASRLLRAKPAQGNTIAQGKTIEDTYTMRYLNQARDALNNDIYGFLGKSDKTSVDHPFTDTDGFKYAQAQKFYKDNVVPYQSSKAMQQIATGTKINPRNITNLFKNPEDSTWQILGHLGDDAKNKIVYSVLGKEANRSNPRAMLKAAKKLDEQGLGEYITPDLQQQLHSLRWKVVGKTIAERGIGAGLGALALHPLGAGLAMPFAGEGVGAVGGALFGPRMFSRAATRIPGDVGSQAVTKDPEFYRLLSRALAAKYSKGVQ